MVKNLPDNPGASGDASSIPGVGKGPGLIPELGQSPGGGNDNPNPHQYPCLGSQKVGLSIHCAYHFHRAEEKDGFTINVVISQVKSQMMSTSQRCCLFSDSLYFFPLLGFFID